MKIVYLIHGPVTLVNLATMKWRKWRSVSSQSQCNTINAVKMLALSSNKTAFDVNAGHLLKSRTVITLMRMANGGPKEPMVTSIIGVRQLCNAFAATRTSN